MVASPQQATAIRSPITKLSMKTFFGSLALLLSLTAVGGMIAYTKFLAMNAPVAMQEAHPTPVVFSQPQTVRLRRSTTAVGTVVASRLLQLKTETVGTVKAVHFQSGQIVQPGDILIELDTDVEQAMLESAQAAEKIATSTYQRIKKAMEVQALSELDLDQTQAQLAQARAEVARMQAVIRRKVLVAPFRARAGVFDVQPGQYLAEGSLITMLQGIDDFVYVDFMMPQHIAGLLKVGESISVEHLGIKSDAQIIALDSQSDRTTRSLLARAKIQSPPDSLHVNDSVRVVAEVGEALDTVVIPASALRTDPTGAFCYVATTDATDPNKMVARRREVQVGSSVGNSVSILQGIELGEQVIADGSFKIFDGTWVVPSDLTTTAKVAP